MTVVNWQYVKNLNEINEAIKNPNDNWDGLTSASDIISITYDTAHRCYVVFWKTQLDVNIKIGRWIVSTVETLDGQGLYECSICKHTEFNNDYNFCPNCGAKMTND